MRDQVKIKVIECLNNASLDESKFNGAISEMVDSIVDCAKSEVLSEVRVMFRNFAENNKPVVEVKDHRSFGKQRLPGEPLR